MPWAGQFLGYAYPATERILRGFLTALWSLETPPAAIGVGPKLALLLQDAGDLSQILPCPVGLDAELGHYEYVFERNDQ